MFNKDYFKDNEWYDVYDKKTVGIKRFLKCIDIEKFKEMLVRDYGRDENSSYAEMSYNACRLGVMYVIQELNKKNKSLLSEISVITGIVNNTWHCWIATYDYYIDLTMQQFIPEGPELFIIKRNKAEKEKILKPMESYTIREWINHEEIYS